MFSCEFYKISKNTFFYRTPLVAASSLRIATSCSCIKCLRSTCEILFSCRAASIRFFGIPFFGRHTVQMVPKYIGAISFSYPPFLFYWWFWCRILCWLRIIETWVWKSTETKLFTSKVLKNLEVTMKKRHGLNTTILSPSWKINKLKNNITKITQQ